MFQRPCCVAACLFAGAAWSTSPALPLKKLRLYDTGVAYYERSGKLDGRGATLPVPTGHLDDVLKTLVVLSHDGGRIGGVEFASSVSKGMARTLAGLPAEADAPIGYPDLLQSLKGTHVLVTTAKERFAARLVDAETVESDALTLGPTPPGETADKDHPPPVVHAKELVLLVLTDASEVRRVKARDVLSLRPTDPGFSARLGTALDALSSHGAQSERSLHVSGSSKAVTLGYIAEAALWRTTYRLVIGPGEQTVLQGWALLHNDTDEDWSEVRIELVNGQPDSFLYPLAAPRYASRPLVTPQNELSTVPQLLDTTVDALWGDHLSGTGSGRGGSSYGEAMGVGGLGTVGHGAGVSVSGSSVSVSASDELQVGNLANVEEAEGVEAGELFTYKLPEPLTLKARGSALVPFLQRKVQAERITWCSTASDTPRAGVRLVNSTDQTLPGGPLSVFSEGGFSGEATIDRLKPRERRVVQFGADPDLQVSQESGASSQEVKRLTFKNDELEEHYLKKSENTLTLENRGGQGRTVNVGLQIATNAQVHGADAMDYDSDSGHPVAVFHLKARAKVERTLASVEGLSRRTPMNGLTRVRLEELASQPLLPEADRKVAKEAAAKQAALEKSREQLSQLQTAMTELEQDTERMREHLKALGGEKGAGSAARDNPFVQRILQAEDKREAIRKQEQDLVLELATRAQAVRASLSRLPPPGKEPSAVSLRE